MAGLGTDTGGSVRGPSTANGIAGLKTTMGLVSRDGVIPLALSFDTGRPDGAERLRRRAMLSVIAGVDPADAATKAGEGKVAADYTQSLKPDALKGARLGIARDFLGQDADVDWVMEASLEADAQAGRDDRRRPLAEMAARCQGRVSTTPIRYPEFVVQIADYLEDARSEVSEEHHRADRARAPGQRAAARRRQPEPGRWSLMVRESGSGTLDDYQYTSVRDHALPLVRAVLDGIFKAEQARRDRLSDGIAPAAAHRGARRDAARRRGDSAAATSPTCPGFRI